MKSNSKKKSFLTCEGCVTVMYCSRNCMDQDEGKHKNICNLFKMWKKGTQTAGSMKIEDEQKLNEFIHGFCC